MKLLTFAVSIAAIFVPQFTIGQGFFGGIVDDLCGGCGAGSALDDLHEEFGQPLDVPGRILEEASVETLGPALAAAMQLSRDDARNAGTWLIPSHIRQALLTFYPASLLDGVTYRVGLGNDLSVQSNSIRYGDADAVALIDTITFASAWDAENNDVLWAHELKHIEQFRNWGLLDFAKRYVRDYDSVEAEAYAAEDAYLQFRSSISTNPMNFPPEDNVPPRPPLQMQEFTASFCATPWGACPMGMAIPIGSQCYCPSFNGPVWGVGQ